MKRSRLFLLVAVFAIFLLTNAAFALDLGVDEIALDPGEFYEFTPQEGTVYWFVSDESVLELGGSEGMGVRALEPGTAVVFAMTDDYLETDSCVVTVTGEAKAVKSGALYYQDLTEEDLAKINDPALAAVLSLANNTAAFPMGIGDLSGFDYKVLIVVKDGSQQKIADAAEAMGLVGTWAYEFVPMAALTGGANVIAKLLIDYRDDIVSVETDVVYTIEPIEEDELESKDVSKLQGNAETLTDIKAAHELGYTGEGQYIAIIDTGIKSNHTQFLDEDGKSRVEYEHCYSSAAVNYGVVKKTINGNEQRVYMKTLPVCADNKTESTSGAPSGAVYKSDFNHGTHVAGIAAGNDGVAPDAKIIAVQAFTEIIYYNLKSDGKTPDYTKDPAAHASTMYGSDELKAYEYILKLMNKGIVPAALNMSYGSGAYSSYTTYWYDSYFTKFLQKGTVPCAASGNNGYNGRISLPAASQKTFAVGALADQDTPAVVSYSNHSELVDILAPGTQIYSALYTDSNTSDVVSSTSAFGKKSGTSMATPMVAGAFALLRQLAPEASAEELEELMLDLAGDKVSRTNVTGSPEVPTLSLANIGNYPPEQPNYDMDFWVSSGDKTITVTTSADENGAAYTGYKVALYTSAGKLAASQIVTAKENKTTTFTKLTNDAVYTVKVAGYLEYNGMKYYSVYAETPMVPMAAPTGFTLTTSGANSVTTDWPNHPTDAYTVQYTTDKNFTSPFTETVGGPHEISGLSPNTTYYFRFRRYNTEVRAAYSPWSAAYTYYLPAMPNAGTDYTVSNSNRTISVKLQQNDNYTGYKIEIVNPDTSKVVSTKTVAVTKPVTYTFSGLTNNKVYNVRVYGYKTVNRVNYFSAAASTQMAPMAVPTGLELTTTEDKTVTAVWTGHETDQISVEYAAEGEDYSVYCGGNGSCTGTIALEQNKVYSFRFRWYNTTCNAYSPYSAVINKLLLDKPVKDTDFTVGSGNRIITVGLNESTVYNGYKIEIVLVSTGKTVSTKTVAVTKDTTYTFSGLTNNAVYDVKVSGYKTVNRVNYFSDAVTTKMVPMTVPTGLELTVNDNNTVTAVWPDNTDKKIKVEYKAETDTSYTEYCTGTGSCTGETVLAKNTVYYFRFSWLNIDCGLYSPVSAEQSRMLIEKPKAEEAKTKVGYKKIRVYFDDVDTLTGHQIKTYIKSSGKLVSTVNVKRTANPDYADITRLTNDVEYKFEIYAYRTVGRTTYYSEPVTVTATPQLKPVDGDAPTDVKASGGAKKITVSWAKDTWTTGHYIELYRTDNLVMVANAYAANSAASYTFSGSKIDYDVPYMIRVWKYNEKSPKATGNSYFDTSAISLAAPGSFAAVSGDKSITATWTYSGVAQNVKVYISTASGGEYTVGCTAASNANTCTISGLANGTLYYVKAEAVYTPGGQSDSLTSADTAVKSVMPLPTSTAAVKAESKKVTVSYTKDDTVTGHIIQLYKVSGSTAKLVKTVTNADKTDSVTVSFTGLANGTPYCVTICSYKTVGRTTYRGPIYTAANVTPSANASASKDLGSVTELTEPFDGFVDPVDELNEQADAEVKEEQLSIFDLFRL